MILKLIGILLMIFGYFMIVKFPAGTYQKSNMITTGIWIGVVAFVMGIVMLVFG